MLDTEQTADIDLDLPGVTPARQKRSRQTIAALLAAGEKLLKTNSLEELSIESLCAELVSLPLYPGIGEEQVSGVCDAIREFFDHGV